MLDAIRQMIADMLNGPMYTAGTALWRLFMNVITGLIGTSPIDFSEAGWTWVSHVLYPWSLGMGVILLNIFFMIGFFKEASDLKQNLTWEILINYAIRAIMGNALLQGGLAIVSEFFVASSALSLQVLSYSEPTFSTNDFDLGTMLFFRSICGLLYLILAIVCAAMIFLTVIGRYLSLYRQVVFLPIAWATWAGGRDIGNSAVAWTKSFLATVFEIVVIAVSISISSLLIQAVDWGTFSTGINQYIDGFGEVVINALMMIMMTAAVKGANSAIRREFGL